MILEKTDYATIIGHMPESLACYRVVLDERGRPVDCIYQGVNPAYERENGLKQEDILGKKVTEVSPELTHSPIDWVGTCGQVALGGGSTSFQMYLESLGRWYDNTVFSPREGYVAVISRDITRQKEEEKQLQEERVLLDQALDTTPLAFFWKDHLKQCKKIEELRKNENQILSSMGQGYQLEEILEGIIQLGESFDPGVKVSVFLMDNRHGLLVPTPASSLPEECWDLLKPGLPVGPGMLTCGTAAYLKKRVIVTDIQGDKDWQSHGDMARIAREKGIRACWSQPIIASDGSVLGTIANFSNKKGVPGPAVLEIQDWSARVAAIAIEYMQVKVALENNFAGSGAADPGENGVARSAVWEARERLLAGLNYEVRTSLHTVLGMIDLLLGTKLSPEQRQYAEKAVSHGNKLMQFMRDITDFAGIAEKGLELEEMYFDLGDVLASVEKKMSQGARDKGLDLEFYINPAVQTALQGDPCRLRQVLSCLGDNALEYTQQGQISVQVDQEWETDKQTKLRFQVRDTGRGISPGELEDLLQPPGTGDYASSFPPESKGLGLAVSRRLVEMMGGEIGARSREGKGSTFWFTILLGKGLTPSEEKDPVRPQVL